MEAAQTLRQQTQLPRRATAKHALVRELLDGSFVRASAEGEASFVESGGERFSRVCVVGTVAEKSSVEGIPAISLFDGTGVISARAVDEKGARALEGINKGEDALVICKLRETRERFLVVEVVRALADANWETVHLLRTALRKKHASAGNSFLRETS